MDFSDAEWNLIGGTSNTYYGSSITQYSTSTILPISPKLKCVTQIRIASNNTSTSTLSSLGLQ